jgi:hypothetical protein
MRLALAAFSEPAGRGLALGVLGTGRLQAAGNAESPARRRRHEARGRDIAARAAAKLQGTIRPSATLFLWGARETKRLSWGAAAALAHGKRQGTGGDRPLPSRTRVLNNKDRLRHGSQ